MATKSHLALRVLVTDGDNRASLAITRSLGRAGCHVFVAHHDHPNLASSSRYCKERVFVPSAADDAELFVSTIAKAVEQYQISAIIPVSDVTTLTLARARQDGCLKSNLCLPSTTALENAADKHRTLELAHQLGVPSPNTILIDNPESTAVTQSSLSYPVVVKPAHSRVRDGNRWLSTFVSYATSPDHLIDLLQKLPRSYFPLLLQEKIEGPGVGVFACYDHGQPIAVFSHKRVREKPPSGGVSVLRESVPVDPLAAKYALALLDALSWHGVAMVEFKMDKRDGGFKLMEINGRFWGSLQLAIDSGVDFPLLVGQILAGIPATRISSYKTGIRSRWLWGDIDGLLALFLKSRNRLVLPSSHPGRWRTLAAFLIPWYPGLRYEVLSLSDPRPWLHETQRWFSRLSGFP